jgi:hypothetical protein
VSSLSNPSCRTTWGSWSELPIPKAGVRGAWNSFSSTEPCYCTPQAFMIVLEGSKPPPELLGILLPQLLSAFLCTKSRTAAVCSQMELWGRW